MTATAHEAIPGEGTIFLMKIASTFVEIGNVYELEGPGMKVVPVATDHLTSVLMTKRPGRIPDPDTISMKIWLDPNDTAMHQLLLTRCNVPGPIDSFEIQFNDGMTTRSTCTFSGFFTSYKLNGMKNQENLGADFEVQNTTIPVFTVGTP